MRKSFISIDSVLRESGGRPSGFDYLRISLSVAIILWHVVVTTYGLEFERGLSTSIWFPIVLLLVPSFFALSGFLVAGSLARNSLHEFMTLRVIRIFPALFVEVLIAALIIGPALTTWSYSDYFKDQAFFKYFLNMLGMIHYELPGLFLDNPFPKTVNQQLWTIPYELECYVALAVLSVIGVMRRPRLLVAFTVVLTIALAAWSVRQGRVGPTPFLEGRLSVLVFLWAVILFVFRNAVPFNGWMAAACAAGAWLSVFRYETAYLGAPAMAYLTIWLGLQNPRRLRLIAGADYSYGMYLYGFAVQQSIVRCLPLDYRVWWITAPLALLLSAFVAYLSWTLVERRVLDHKTSILRSVNLVVSKLRPDNSVHTRKLLVRGLVILMIIVGSIVGIEQAIEYKEARRFSDGDSFAITANNLLVRYNRLGEHPTKPAVIFISGLGYSLEESLLLQRALSKEVSTMSYDRGGRGFSRSLASSVGQQANELADLLDALGWVQPVVLVGYSTGGMVARVFASRFPNRTAGLYLIEPSFPEMDIAIPNRHGPFRRYIKWMLTSVAESFSGIMRIRTYASHFTAARTEDKLKVDAILIRSWHNLAMAREWLLSALSAKETLAAEIPTTIPIEIAMSKPGENIELQVLKQFASSFLEKQHCGLIRELPEVDHKEMMQSGPAAEALVAGIASFASNASECGRSAKK